MRVLLLHNRLHPQSGGIATSLHYGARALRDLGHDVTIMTAQSEAWPRGWHESDGVSVYAHARHPLPLGDMFRLPAMVERIAEALTLVQRQAQVDLIVARSLPYAAAVMKAAPSVPMIYFPPNPWGMILDEWIRTNPRQSLRDRVLLAAHRTAGSRGSRYESRLVATRSPRVRYAALSATVRRNLQSAWGDVPIRIIPPGVDVTRYAPAQPHAMAVMRATLGLRPDERVVLSVGRLETEKNPHALIAAFMQHVRTPNVRLLLAGDGSERGVLERQAASDPRITFLGHQGADLPLLYSLADVFVLPSLVEGFGQTLLEALACGTPCVAFGSDGGRVRTAAREILEDCRHSRVVGKADSAALAGAIDAVLSQTDDRAAQAAHCRSHVTARYSWEAFARNLLDLATDILPAGVA